MRSESQMRSARQPGAAVEVAAVNLEAKGALARGAGMAVGGRGRGLGGRGDRCHGGGGQGGVQGGGKDGDSGDSGGTGSPPCSPVPQATHWCAPKPTRLPVHFCAGAVAERRDAGV